MNINLMSFSMKKLELQPRRNRKFGIIRSTRMVSLTPEVLAFIWWAVRQKSRPRARICCSLPSAVGALDACALDNAPQISLQTPTASQIWVKVLHPVSAVKVICSRSCRASLKRVWIWLAHLHWASDDQTQHTAHSTFYITGGFEYWPWVTWWQVLLVISVEISSTHTHTHTLRLLFEITECLKTKREKYCSQTPIQTHFYVVVEIISNFCCSQCC